MDPRSYWQRYVTQHGGATGVADRLGIPYPTVAAVCNGRRGIGRRLAELMASKDSSLDASVLVWVRPAPEFVNTPGAAAPDVTAEAG